MYKGALRSRGLEGRTAPILWEDMMQRNKEVLLLNQIADIKAGKPAVKTTEKSEFNLDSEANRPTSSRYMYPEKGRMLTQREMSTLRRNEQIWPNGVDHDAAEMRSFRVTRKNDI